LKSSEDKSFKGKDKLISVALEQFSDKGYVKASINDILNEAGISKGTFYYHFKNKEDLYLYLVGVLITEKKRYFSQKVMVKAYEDNDIFSLLLLLIKTGLEFARDNPHIYRFSERFMKEKGTSIYDMALSKYNFDDNDLLNQLLKEAIERGELRRDIPENFIKSIVIFLLTHSVEIFNSMNLEEYEHGFEYFIKFLKNGLENNKL